jgi:hypothetical protein
MAYRRGAVAAWVGRNRSSEGRICEPGVMACESERQSVRRSIRCKDHGAKGTLYESLGACRI